MDQRVVPATTAGHPSASRTTAPTWWVSIRKPSCPYADSIVRSGRAVGAAATISSDSRGG